MLTLSSRLCLGLADGLLPSDFATDRPSLILFDGLVTEVASIGHGESLGIREEANGGYS
jgi:hypothetical protein